MRKWTAAAAAAVVLSVLPVPAVVPAAVAAGPPPGTGVPGSVIGLAKQDGAITTAVYIDVDGVLNVAWTKNTEVWRPAARVSASVAAPGSPVALAKQTKNRITAAFMDKQGRLNVAWADNMKGWHQPVPITGEIGVKGGNVALAQPTDDSLVAAFVDKQGAITTVTVTGTGQWGPPVALGGAIGIPGSTVALSRHLATGVDRLYAAIIDNTGTLNTAYRENGSWTAPAVVGVPLTKPGAPVALAPEVNNTFAAMFVSDGSVLYVSEVKGRGAWQEPVLYQGSTPLETVSQIAGGRQSHQITVAAMIDYEGRFAVGWNANNGPWHGPDPVGVDRVAPGGGGVALVNQTGTIFTAAFMGNDGVLNVTWNDDNHGWALPRPIPTAWSRLRELTDEARTLWGRGEREAAVARAREGVALARDMAANDPGFDGMLGEVLLDPTAGYLAETGRRAEAIAALREAAGIFLRVGDVPQADTAKRRLAALGVFVGRWTVHQTNGFVGRMDITLADADGNFSGTADWGDGLTGTIELGRLTPTDVVLEIQLSNGSRGRYTGHLGGDLRWTGEAVDLTHPPIRADWWAEPTV